MASVPTVLTKKNRPDKVRWTADCNKAFQSLKNALAAAPVLQIASLNRPFILQIDASDLGLGAVLSQRNDSGKEHPVAYLIRRLSPHERNYSVIEKECLAIVWALKHFQIFLFGTTLQFR